MVEKLDAVLKESLVWLYSYKPENHIIGFLISPTIILTSLSFVRSSSSREFRVRSQISSQDTKAFFKEECYQNYDLAFLHCQKPLPRNAHFLHKNRLSNIYIEKPSQEYNLIAYGYKQNSSQLHQVRLKNTGEKLDQSGQRLIQLELENKNITLATGLPLIEISHGSRLCGIIASPSSYGENGKARKVMENEIALPITEDSTFLEELSNDQSLDFIEHLIAEGTSEVSLKHQVSKNREKVNNSQASKYIEELEKQYKADAEIPYSNIELSGNKDFVVGRQNEIQEILKRLSDNFREHIIVVEGINGIGKSALVKHIASICYRNSKKPICHQDQKVPNFDAIVLVSTKQIYSNTIRYSEVSRVEPSLHKIFRTIAKTIKSSDILHSRGKEQLDLVYQKLRDLKTLLIIDNLEAIDSVDRKQILAFLANLPLKTKAIITTRFKMDNFSSIQLSNLSETESREFIGQKEKYKKIKLTEQKKKSILGSCQGIPINLLYAVGREKAGISKNISSVDEEKNISAEESVSLSFEDSINSLRKKPAFEILRALVIFQAAPCLEALSAVAGLKLEDIGEDLTLLEQLSLIQQKRDRYYMLPTTREHMLTELAKYQEFEADARERWITWYLDFTGKYGGKDDSNWKAKLNRLDAERENIFSVLHWCSSQDLYEKALKLWENIDTYIDLSGYWQIRRYWWKWLIKESDRRADIPTNVKAISERAWTLTLMGAPSKENVNPEYQSDAGKQFNEALKFYKYAEPDTQVKLFIHIAIHRLINKEYAEAFDWLDKAEQNLEICQDNFADIDLIDRYKILIKYHRAENIYWEQNHNDTMPKNIESIKQAKEIFESVLRQAQEIQWERYENYIINWLGRIWLDLGNTEKSESYLSKGLEQAIKNHDNRRIKYYCDVYSSLEEKRNNIDESKEFKKFAKHFSERENIVYP